MKVSIELKSLCFPKVDFINLVPGQVYLGKLSSDIERWHFLRTDEGSVVRLMTGALYGPGSCAIVYTSLYECEHVMNATLTCS